MCIRDSLSRGLAAAVARSPPPADAGDACAPPSQLSSALMDRAWAAAVAKLALAEVDDCEPSLLADALRHLVVAGGLAGEVRGALQAARAACSAPRTSPARPPATTRWRSASASSDGSQSSTSASASFATAAAQARSISADDSCDGGAHASPASAGGGDRATAAARPLLRLSLIHI